MPAAAGPTLAQVVERLGPATVELLHGADRVVRGPRLWDPDDLAGLAPGDVVLGVGAPGDDVLAQCAAAGVAAVALRGDVAGRADEAARLDVGLLRVLPGVTWDQLHSLLQQASAVPAREPDAAPVGDLFAFANALAALVGGAVAVEDPQSNLLAYSNLDQPIDQARRETILGRGNPRDWSQLLEDSGYSRLLATTEGPVRITDPTGAASERVAVLVRAGSEVLGSLWVVAGDEPLGPQAEDVLRDAVPLAAMQLLRLRSHEDSSRRTRGQALRAVLDGDSARLADLGLDDATSCQLVAFELATADDQVQLSTGRTRVVDAVTLACEAFRRQVVCTWSGSRIFALFPDVSAATEERLVSIVEDICARTTAALGVELTAGISAAHDGLASAALCRTEAERVLRVLAARPGQRVARLEDVRISSVLLALGDVLRERDDLRTPGVRLLRAQDEAHGKTYVATLRAYLDAGASIPGAAALLGVHANTLRYRLAKVQEISGLDLDDPEQRLVAALELLALS